jgi:hypothetical protein
VSARPRGIRLRAYRVGRGDCLLLTVTYGSAPADGRPERHILVDFGTAAPPPDGPSPAEVAGRVVEHCGGRLDVVVATHRHPEHLSGFTDPEVRRILEPLQPDVVVRPWTDAPRRSDLSAGARRFLALLDDVHPLPPSLLDDWARHGRTQDVSAGTPVDLLAQLPGVTVETLGPPGSERVGALLSPARAGAEPWLQLAADPAAARLLAPEPGDRWDEAFRLLAEPAGAGAAEQLLHRLRAQRLAPGLEMAAAFDDVVHDTSAVLLVTVGSRSVLLPGGAREAGWGCTLDRAWGVGGNRDAQLSRRLADVDVYVAGGHAARAGTPGRLLNLLRRRLGSARPLVSVVSTDGTDTDDRLLADLEALGPVHRTDRLPAGVEWVDVELPAHGRLSA